MAAISVLAIHGGNAATPEGYLTTTHQQGATCAKTDTAGHHVSQSAHRSAGDAE